MKKLLSLLPLFIAFAFLLSSCDSNSTDAPVNETGTVILSSSPTGAQIYEGTTLLGTTPDTLSLSTGSHSLTFKLSGYKDTTVTYTVEANVSTQKHVTLTSTQSITKFGFTTPIQIFETDDPSSSDPSGVQLSSGKAYGISGTNKSLVDLIYRSSDYNFISANDWTTGTLTRVTYFKTGSAADMTDTASAPLFDAASWTKKIPDTQSNYFFAYDNEHHYAKIKIVSKHLSSGPGDYGWVKLQWIFNNTVGDRRF